MNPTEPPETGGIAPAVPSVPRRFLSPTTGQIVVTTTAQRLASGTTPVRSLCLINPGSSGGTTVYVGGASVTDLTGYPIQPATDGTTLLAPDGTALDLSAFYCICAGSATLAFLAGGVS